MRKTWEVRINEDKEWNFRTQQRFSISVGWLDEVIDLMMIVCGCIGDELMMIMIRIAWKSRCLVLGLLLGKTLIV
jgi:hypothetical protein